LLPLLLRIGLAILSMTLANGCLLRAPATPPGSALEVMYRQRRGTERSPLPAAPAVTTSAYRDILAKSIFSRCRMVPSDSEMFDILLKRCGVVRSVMRSSARLLLERAATPAYLRPVRLEGHLRWLDLPGRNVCD
jgi:hypothetical protein